MLIYCDRLTLRSCAKAIQLRRCYLRPRGNIILHVLDPLPKGWWAAILRLILRILNFKVEEARFVAGHLRMPDGQSVYISARWKANEISFQTAERMLEHSHLLTKLNREWGRNTIFLHLAKSIWKSAERLVMRFWVADALVRNSGEQEAFLIAMQPNAFDQDILWNLSPRLKIQFYRSGLGWCDKNWAYPLLWVLRQLFLKLKWSIELLIRRAAPHFSDRNLPSLLLLQEDDISLDRSYRTQPHWLFSEGHPLPFRTLILQTGSVNRMPAHEEELRMRSIFLLSPRDWYLASRSRSVHHPLKRRLYKDLRSCLYRCIFGNSKEIAAMPALVPLLYSAADLTDFCKHANVKAFMTCENYMRWADAMQLIAPLMDIRTISYQYSNMNRVGPFMMTTSDMMVTFSPLYHQRWAHNGIRPGKFIDAGYVFDGSFKYVRERAYLLKSQLARAGAKFIICYFDENPITDKYGIVTFEAHWTEILTLLSLVIDDPSIGLIVKTQFQWNSPRHLGKLENVRVAAESTGRYVELTHGLHRNIVFPAEAALSADIIIGQAVGSTASLEAALAGGRSILLNPYDMKGDNDPLYARADIVYSSLEDALEAIKELRRGKPERIDLGDWSPIIHHFDPFRDGRSGERMRRLLEQSVLRDNPSS